MIFELISWIYISFICFTWGNLVVNIFFRNGLNVPEFDFSVLCLIGMSLIGIVVFYLSIWMPLNGWVKFVIQVPSLLYGLRVSNRNFFLKQFKESIGRLSKPDVFLLGVSILMVFFISTSSIIHPDTFNYHLSSIRIFGQYGIIPGVANLKPELGFQSLWFAVESVFDLSFMQPGISYPLSGCILCWFIIFLISSAAGNSIQSAGNSKISIAVMPGLLLLLFAGISWTQIRLTAASTSPDFIVTIFILTAFYFFIKRSPESRKEYNFLFAIFFALVAVTIKLSAIAIIFIPVFLFFYGVVKKNFNLIRITILLTTFFLAPLLIRNIVATGYPLYPSSFANIFPVDWKLSLSRLTQFQQYITDYARYPMGAGSAEMEHSPGWRLWLPLWWKHLYISDKLMILTIVSGLGLNIIFFRKWIRGLSTITMTAFVISLTGVLIWFINGPDPRFGTGFLFALIYFQYSPFSKYGKLINPRLVFKGILTLKYLSTFLILAYIVYRSIYFFQPRQLIFPLGIKEIPPVHADCSEYIKEILFPGTQSFFQLPDSCKAFLNRGNSLKDGFKPIH